jgi:hypothetical protein
MKHLKLIALFVCIILLPALAFGQTYTWTGATNSSWTTSSNWTPVGIPGAGATVNITNPAPPNHPTLAGNTTIANITVTGGRLFLNTSTLTVTIAARFTNAIVDNGRINAVDFTTLTGTTFSTSIILNKTSGIDNTWAGGNTFNNLTLINNDNNWIRMAGTTADVFNGSTQFTTTNQYIDVAYTRNATFNGNVTINATGGNGIRFGQNGGATTIASGFALLTTGYTSGQLTLRNITQSGTTANGTFSPTNFTPTNCIFGGNFTCTATTASITTSQFTATNSFTATNLSVVRQSTFSSISGTTTFTKTAGAGNTWFGGNSFYNTTIFNNSTNQTISLGSTAADAFFGTTRFVTSGTNRINIAITQNAAFNGNVFIDNTSTAGIYFGATGGSTTIASGYSLLTNGYTAGTLSLLRVTQSGTVANGSFAPITFISTNSSFGGNFTLASATTATITGSTFSRTNSFRATNISNINTSVFSNLAGATTITKTAGTTNTWTGGNTYTNCTFTNSSTNVLIRMGTTAADTYDGTTRFIASGSNYFEIAYTSNATFNGNVFVDCTSSNGIYFGASTGTTSIASGSALLTNGFSSGTLSLRRVTQNGSAANGSFSPTTFVANTATMRGNFTATVSGTSTITNSIFQRTNSFTSGTFATMSGNNFSATSGTTTFTKTANTAEIWNGNNTFYNTTVINNSTSQYIRLAGVNGDAFLGTTRFAVSNAATIQAAYNLASTFAGNVYLDCTGTGGITIGAGTGTAAIATGFSLKTNGYTGAPLNIDAFTQADVAANDSFSATTLTITNSSIAGSLTCNASTVSLSNNSFTGNNKFYANTYSTVTACTFSQGSASTVFTKRGATNDTWVGGNTFGNVTFRNRSNGRIRLANTNPDTHNGTVIIVQDSTGAIEVAYNGANSFRENISILGSTTAVTLGAGTGTIQINGNTAQSILGNGSVALNISRLLMSTSGSLTLNTPVTILTNAQFVNGRILTDATNFIIFNDNATATNANIASCVSGPVRKIGNDLFQFPIGNLTYFAPIAISAPLSATDHFTAQYFRSNPNDAGFDASSLESTIESVSSAEYWNLDRTNGTSAVEVTMSWGDHSNQIFNMTALRVAHWDATGQIWNDLGFKNFIGTEAAGSVTTANAVTSFSPFSFGSAAGGGALPVEMTSFTGHVVPEGVALNWTTQIEINNDRYNVERSVDGVTFETIGEVSGAGNSSVEKHYEYIDTDPKEGLLYYRLKQVDIDGAFENSELVSVLIKGSEGPTVTWAIYPNPAQSKIEISGGETGKLVEVEITDQTGRSISHAAVTFGNNESLDVSTLSPGMYILKLVGADGVGSQRFIKQ